MEACGPQVRWQVRNTEAETNSQGHSGSRAACRLRRQMRDTKAEAHQKVAGRLWRQVCHSQVGRLTSKLQWFTAASGHCETNTGVRCAAMH